MRFFSLRKWLTRAARSSRRSSSVCTRVPFRPLEVEALEERLTPATDIWSGGPAGNANFNWSHAANWSNGVPNPGDDLVFPQGVPAASLANVDDLPNGTLINSITFGGSGYVLTGKDPAVNTSTSNSIVLGTAAGGNTIVSNTSTTGNVVQLDLQLGASAGNREFFTVDFGADLTLSGKLSGTGVNLTKEGIGGTLVLTNDNSGLKGPVTVDQGVLEITNAKALGDGSSSATVVANAQIALLDVAGQINQNVILNGPGPASDGALLNVDGANTWAGSVVLDSNVILGSAQGAAPGSSSLNITGQISDLGSGHNVTKEGLGQIIFSAANTYRGTTTIDNGILTIRNAKALGTGDGTAATGTVVNQTSTSTATLQLEDPTGVGFTVQNEQLVLNGQGFNGLGALDNLNGNNAWEASVTLGSPAPQVSSTVSIGVDAVAGAPTSLTIDGVINDLNGPYNLNKVGLGRLILTNSNVYRGFTTVASGMLNVRDSQALGAQGKTNGTTVAFGAALELQVDSGSLNNPDSITGTLNTLQFLQPLTINGEGITKTGALRSISGINVWNGVISLGSSTAAIGVDADPSASSSNSYFPTFNAAGQPISGDFSLTVVPNASNGGAGIISGATFTTLEKVGAGQLILPAANPYLGPTRINQGWITIQNNRSLGAHVPGLGDTVQPFTTVVAGAALHLKAPTPGGILTVPNNLILAGVGIVHPFALMSQQGALLNLDGLNTATGSIKLNGNTGIGVEQADSTAPPVQSELSLTGELSDAVPGTAGGLIKLGSRRLNVQGDGTFTGPVDISQGAILNQNDAGLGIPGGGAVTVEPGTALQLQTGVASLNGGIAAGIQVWGKALVLNGAGQQVSVAGSAGTFSLTFNSQTTSPLNPTDVNLAGDMQSALNALSTIGGANGSVAVTQKGSVFTIVFGGALATAPNPLMTATTTGNAAVAINGALSPLVNTSDDNMWRGPVTLHVSSNIDVEPSSRLTLYGPVDDSSNALVTGSNLIKVGTGELDLAGTSTYRGQTNITQGIVVVQGGQALGGAALSEVQTVAISGTSGSFTLTFNGQTTGALPFNASAAQVQSALNALSTIGGGSIGGSVSVSLAANVYSITFGGNLSGFQQPLLSAAGAGGTTATVAEATIGSGAVVVANGASLELQGNITVAGKPIVMQGSGVAAVPNVPTRWFQQGPAPIIGGQTPGNGNVTGRVTGVAVDPTDPNVIYISTAGGGAWKTKNGGATWLPLFDAPSGTFTGAIAVAPSDPRVIYLGTGDADNSFDSFSGTGLYKSTDSGLTWALVSDPTNPLNHKAISRIAVDYNNPNIVYVADGDQGMLSTSGDANVGIWRFDGTSWFNLTNQVSVNRATLKGSQTAPPKSPGPDDDFRITFPQLRATWSDLVLDRSGELYAALGSAAGLPANAVYRCINPTSGAPIWYIGDPGGKVDNESSTEFPNSINTSGRQASGNIKITAVNPAGSSVEGNTTLYALVTNSVTGAVMELDKSVNGGVSWATIATPPPNYMGSQGAYDSTVLAVDPTTIYVGGHTGAVAGVLVSVDSGLTWTPIAADQSPSGNGPHSDAHALAMDSLGRVVIGTDGGVWRLTTAANPAFSRWADINGNLAITQFNGIALNPSSANTAFGASRNNGIESFTGGLGWTFADTNLPTDPHWDAGIVRIDQRNPNNVYQASNGSLFKSTTGGVVGSFTNILRNVTAGTYFPFALDGTNPNRLVAGGASILQESLDGGATWINLNIPGSPAANVTGVALATNQGSFVPDPGFPSVTDHLANTYDPNTIYAIANNQVYVTKNQGLSWQLRNTGLSGNLVDIEVDPRNRDTAYVVVGGIGATPSKIFVTGSAGISWTDISGQGPNALPNISTHKLAIDPRNGNLYVGNDNGVWLSTDSGTSWHRFGAGLPDVSVMDVALNTSLNTLAAATYGRSVYQLWLDDSQANAGALNTVSGSAIWTGPVILAGDTVIGARGTQAIQDGISTATLSIFGSIGDAVGTSAPRLTKTGLGDVILSGANTYAGVTDIQQGVLVVHNPQALGGTTNGTIVENGTALELQSSVNGEPLSLTGDGVAFNGHNTGALHNASNNNVYSGPVTLETSATIGVESGSSLVVAGSIAKDPAVRGTAGLTKELTGTLILAAANTYDGLTAINQGILQVQNSNALGTGAGAAAGVQVMDGSQLQLQAPVVQTATIGGATTGSFTLTFNGQTTTALPFGAPATGAGSVQDALNALSSIGGAGGSVSVTKVGNVYTISFQGLLTGFAQPLIGANGSGGTTVTVAMSLGAPLDVVGKTLTLSGTGIVGTGAVLNTGGNNTWQGPVILTGIPAFSPATIPPANVSFGVSNTVDDLTVDGPISELPTTDISDFGLTKVGPGKLTLKQADSYTGSTTVVTGILNVEDSEALGKTTSSQTTVDSGAALELQANVADNHVDSITGTTNIAPLGSLILSGAGIVPGGLGALRNVAGNNSWTGTIALSTTSTVGVDAGTQLTVSNNAGGISGAATSDLNKVGAGTLIFSTPNTYLGQTLVDAGLLMLRALGSLGAPSGALAAVFDGAGLQLMNLSAPVPAAKAIQLSGTGVNKQGALENVSGASFVLGPVALVNDSSIGVDQNGDTLTLNGVVSGGSHALTKVGPGALQLAGNASNTYTGLTSVNDGTLQLNKSGATAIVGDLTVGDGTPAAFGSDVAQLLQSNQVSPGSTVTVNSDGLFDLTSQTQSIVNLIMTGGTVSLGQAGSQLTVTGAVTATSDLQSNGGNAASISGAGNAAGTLVLAPARGATTTVFNTNPGGGPVDLQISAVITAGPGVGLTKAGTGTMDLTNKEAYPGVTSVNKGTLNVDAPGQTGAVSVNGGTLGGTGAVGAVTVTNLGVGLHPGDSAGILSVTGDVTLNAQTTFGVTIGGNTPAPTGFSQLLVNGNVNLTGATLSAALANGYSPTAGVDTFTIIQVTGAGHSVSGQFAQAGIAVLGGLEYSITYTATTVVLERLVVNTNTLVTSSADPSVFGQPVTFTATVSPAVNGVLGPIGGKVDFILDGATVASGIVLNANDQATFSTTSLPAPLSVTALPHTLKAVFTDTDNNFNNSFGVLNNGQTVNKAGTTTTVAADSNPSTFGQTVTFTATVQAVSPGTGVPAGTVDFIIDGTTVSSGVTLANGQATFQTSSLSSPLTVSGSPHTVQVSFHDSDGNYNNSSGSVPGNEVIVKAGTTVHVASTNTNSVFGEAVITATITPQFTGTPGGTVTFSITHGATTVTETDPVAAGVATLTNTVLNVGTYMITATYSGDSNFLSNANSNAVSQTVNPARTNVGIASSTAGNPSVYGQNVTFTATVAAVLPGSGAPDGTVTWFVDGTRQAADAALGNGKAVLTINSLTVSGSPHTITATYNPGASGDFQSNSGALAGGQAVAKAPTATTVTSSVQPSSVFGQPVTFTATVAANPNTFTPGGTVDFIIDGSTVASGVTLTSGQAAYTTSGLSVSGAGHTVTATYNPPANPNFTASSGALAGNQVVTRDATATTAASSPSTSTYGQGVTLTATVSASAPGSGTPSGTVLFYLNSTGNFLGAGTLNQQSTDQATYSTTTLQLTGDTHNIIAVYQGDGSFLGSQGSTPQTVQRAATSTSGVNTNNAGAVYGQSITLSANVSAAPGLGTPTGLVNFYDGPVNSTDLIGSTTANPGGTASITFPSTSPAFPSLSVGSHTITAVYQGDVNFLGSMTPDPQLVQVVSKAGTSTTLSSDTLPSAVYGQETIAATVADNAVSSTGTPTGSVIFTISAGSTPLASQTVALVNGVATLTSPSSPSTVLTELTASGPSGAVYTITAAYQGDGNFNTSNTGAALTQQVTQANSNTVLSATPSNNQSVAGQQVTFTAVVTAASPGAGFPTGSVQFFNGSTQIGATQTLSLVGGQETASVSISSLAVSANPYSISAVYAGDNNFITSTSNTVAFTVGKSGTTTTVASSAPTSTYGSPVTFTATVAAASPGNGTATGTVSFYDGTIDSAHLLGAGTLNQNALSDQASFTTTALQLAGGNHTIIAAYAGDTSFSASQSSGAGTNQVVQAMTTTTALSSTVSTPRIGRPFTVTAQVTPAVPGMVITGGTVSFTVDGQAPATVVPVNAAGQATFTVTFASAGNHAINATYSGDSNFATSIAPTLNETAVTQVGAFVAQVYRDLFHREVDGGGLAFWTNALNQGLGRTQFVSILESSLEYRTDVVEALYVHYLHRQADSGGLSYFVGAMGTGTTDEQIASFLAGSDEYFANRGGNTVDGFLTALYSDALNRAVDSGGRQSFTQALSFHVSRQQVAAIVLGSFEYKADLVTAYYSEFLHRGTDSGGLNFWATRMTQGLTDEAFIAALVGSDEYFNNV